jgi:phosphoglycolate phosphatase
LHPVPEAVLFDLDGTLLDSLPGISYSIDVAFATCGLSRSDIPLRSLIGPPIRTILSLLCPSASEKDLTCLEKSFRTSYDADGWRKTYHYAGAVELLKKMRTWHITLFVVSNKPLHVSVKILKTAGTLPLFESIMTRDSRNPSYSGKSEMVSCLLAEHSLASNNCLMVGDTAEDAEASAYNGLTFYLMTHGYGNEVAEGDFPVKLQFDNFAAFMSKVQEEWKND